MTKINRHPSTNSTTINSSRSGGTSILRKGNSNEQDFLSSQKPPPSTTMGETANGEHKNTLKYRCKLCGAYKQGHICPYRKSLQRTIGVMMCPAVNAYSSVEPGVLTPFLSEMNNFVPYGKTSYDDDNGIDGGHDRGRGGPYDSSDMDTEVASSSREDESTTGSRLTSEGTTKKTNKSHQHQSTHHHHSPNSSSLSTSTSSRHSSSKGQHSSSPGESLPS